MNSELHQRRKIDYEFINPSEGKDAKQRECSISVSYEKGLNPD